MNNKYRKIDGTLNLVMWMMLGFSFILLVIFSHSSTANHTDVKISPNENIQCKVKL